MHFKARREPLTWSSLAIALFLDSTSRLSVNRLKNLPFQQQYRVEEEEEEFFVVSKSVLYQRDVW
jgi:hypothetical protein